MQELGQVLEKNNDFSELFDEVKDALDDLIALNFDDEEDFEQLRIVLKKLIEKITVDRDGKVDVKTIFGWNLNEIVSAVSEVSSGKEK